jgi:chemotaxis protein CheX
VPAGPAPRGERDGASARPRARRRPRAAAHPLPERLDGAAAPALREALLARRGRDLALEAGSVRRLGGLCLQVLLAARATWQEDGHVLRILNPSPEFEETVRFLAAAPALGLEEAVS